MNKRRKKIMVSKVVRISMGWVILSSAIAGALMTNTSDSALAAADVSHNSSSNSNADLVFQDSISSLIAANVQLQDELNRNQDATVTCNNVFSILVQISRDLDFGNYDKLKFKYLNSILSQTGNFLALIMENHGSGVAANTQAYNMAYNVMDEVGNLQMDEGGLYQSDPKNILLNFDGEAGSPVYAFNASGISNASPISSVPSSAIKSVTHVVSAITGRMTHLKIPVIEIKFNTAVNGFSKMSGREFDVYVNGILVTGAINVIGALYSGSNNWINENLPPNNGFPDTLVLSTDIKLKSGDKISVSYIGDSLYGIEGLPVANFTNLSVKNNLTELLGVPQDVQIHGGILSWYEVPGAAYYVVSFKDGTTWPVFANPGSYTVHSTHLDISKRLKKPGIYELVVTPVPKGSNANVSNEPSSSPVKYTAGNYIQLLKYKNWPNPLYVPWNVQIKGDTLVWNNLPIVKYYTVTVDTDNPNAYAVTVFQENTHALRFNLLGNSRLRKPGHYSVSVRAVFYTPPKYILSTSNEETGDIPYEVTKQGKVIN